MACVRERPSKCWSRISAIEIDGGDFDAKFIAAVAKSIYVNTESPPGRDSFAGDRVPDGMAFATNTQGKPLNTPQNVHIAFLRMGVSFRYDAFSDQYFIDGLPGVGPIFNDAAERRLRLRINDAYGFLPQKDLLFDICYDTARYYSFDPVNDYFDKVQDKWDHSPRIESFLTKYAGAEDTPYVREVSQLLFMSIVHRNRNPGAKFDEMIVLESPQGKDKSGALAVLALKPEWFSDSFPLNAHNRETLEHAQGKIIIEVAELQGFRKAEIEHVKAMLSRQTDRGRMAYARTQTEVERRFIFVGTSNGQSYLIDPTGNRRFWPVEIKKFDLKAVKRDRDQLWGEAAFRDALGLESIRMDAALWADAGVEQDKRVAANDDPFTDAFRVHLGDKTGRITSEDAWAILGIDVGRRTPELNKRFGASLKAIGWTRKTVKLEPGKEAHRVQGYGFGDDTRRLLVACDGGRQPYVYYEDEPDEGVSGKNREDWPDAAE